MRLNREKLLNLWDLEDMPACDAGMQLVESFLMSCGEAVDRFWRRGAGGSSSADHGELHGTG
jgi:hypothetical protein